jgi:hypothetical protein
MVYSPKVLDGKFSEVEPPLYGVLSSTLRHGPTRFTHPLPRVYACLTPSYRGGCTLSVDLGVVWSFSRNFRSPQPSGWTLPLHCLLLGLWYRAPFGKEVL